MSNPLLKNTNIASLCGSWPFSPHPTGATQPQLLTGVVNPSARILSTLKSNSFDLNGKSFKLHVDSHVSSPFTVAFTDDGMTLQEVIDQINSDTSAYGSDVAFNDNGFLLFRSAVTGEGSYLRLESINTSEEVFSLLGLYAETTSQGGELAQAPHADPSRQIGLPGQMMMNRGEPFSVDVLNRVAFNMANSATRLYGLFEKKRIATLKKKTISSFTTTYFQPGEIVYTGPEADPAPEQVEEILAILDTEGNEIIKEYQDDPRATVGGDTITPTYDEVLHEQYLTFNSATCYFDSGDAKGDGYVVMTGFTGDAVVFNDVPLKVTRVIITGPSSAKVAILNINPVNGERVYFTEVPTSATRVLIHSYKVRAGGFYKDSALTTRIEQVQDTIVASVSVTGIELNNRIVANGADFVANGVSEGDLVVWSGFTTSGMYTNNGTYRVGRVIDNETLELLSEDFTPVLLNPIYTGYGSVVVKTDGDFWNDPYISFDPQDRADPPVPDGDFIIVCSVVSTLKGSLDDNPAAFTGNVKYLQEASYAVERALIGLTGPSVDSLTDVNNFLYSDRRNNIEVINSQFDSEHYREVNNLNNHGRHATIHPDVIDMYPGVTGTTLTVRKAASDAASLGKIKYVNQFGYDIFTVAQNGVYQNYDSDIVNIHETNNGTITEKFYHAASDWHMLWNFDSTFLNLSGEGDGGAFADIISASNENGFVGIGAHDPTHQLTVQSRSVASDHDVLLSLKGFDSGVGNKTTMEFYSKSSDVAPGLRLGISGHIPLVSTLETTGKLQLEGTDLLLNAGASPTTVWMIRDADNCAFVPDDNQDIGATSPSTSRVGKFYGFYGDFDATDLATNSEAIYAKGYGTYNSITAMAPLSVLVHGDYIDRGAAVCGLGESGASSILGIGGATNGVSVAGYGLEGVGGAGSLAQSKAAGYGVKGQGGSVVGGNGAAGVYGIGGGGAEGLRGLGGADGPGVYGVGGTDGRGGYFLGTGDGEGLYCEAGATAPSALNAVYGTEITPTGIGESAILATSAEEIALVAIADSKNAIFATTMGEGTAIKTTSEKGLPFQAFKQSGSDYPASFFDGTAYSMSLDASDKANHAIVAYSDATSAIHAVGGAYDLGGGTHGQGDGVFGEALGNGCGVRGITKSGALAYGVLGTAEHISSIGLAATHENGDEGIPFRIIPSTDNLPSGAPAGAMYFITPTLYVSNGATWMAVAYYP